MRLVDQNPTSSSSLASAAPGIEQRPCSRCIKSAFIRDLLSKARDAECTALVFTVDMHVPGSRHRDYRSGLGGATGIRGAARRIGQAMLRP